MRTLLFSILLSAFFIPGSWASNAYSLAVVKQPDQRWQFQRMIAFTADSTTQLSGRLTANLRFGLPHGHVDVAAYTPSGKLIAATTTNYVPAILTHSMKKKGGVRFSVEFDQILPTDAVIKVAFHQAEPYSSVKPSHKGNIAQ